MNDLYGSTAGKTRATSRAYTTLEATFFGCPVLIPDIPTRICQSSQESTSVLCSGGGGCCREPDGLGIFQVGFDRCDNDPGFNSQ